MILGGGVEMKGAIQRLKAVIIAGMLSSISLLDATAASMEDAIIIYGGVGNLGRDAQPCLAMLYETGDKKFLPYTDKINDAIRKTLSEITLFTEKKSVIVEADQLNAAIKESGIEFKNRPSQIQIKEFIEDNEGNIFALSIIGGSELYTKYNKNVGERNQKVGNAYIENFIVSVAAILTQISGDNAGQVVLSAISFSEVRDAQEYEGYLGQGEVGCNNSATISNSWLERVAVAYAGAAVSAIKILAKKKQAASEDTTSVIVMGVSVDSEAVKNLYRTINTDLKSINSICEIPLPCSDDDKRCKGLIGSLAFALTETFSSRGYLAIPPLNWGAWGKSGQYQVAKNLKMTGGRSDVLPFVQMNVGPSAADRKLHSAVTKFVEKDLPDKKTKHIGFRHYLGWMTHRWEETEYDQCEVVEYSGSYPETKSHKNFLRPVKQFGTDVPIGQRLQFVAATLLDAVFVLGKKIELD